MHGHAHTLAPNSQGTYAHAATTPEIDNLTMYDDTTAHANMAFARTATHTHTHAPTCPNMRKHARTPHILNVTCTLPRTECTRGQNNRGATNIAGPRGRVEYVCPATRTAVFVVVAPPHHGHTREAVPCCPQVHARPPCRTSIAAMDMATNDAFRAQAGTLPMQSTKRHNCRGKVVNRYMCCECAIPAYESVSCYYVQAIASFIWATAYCSLCTDGFVVVQQQKQTGFPRSIATSVIV